MVFRAAFAKDGRCQPGPHLADIFGWGRSKIIATCFT